MDSSHAKSDMTEILPPELLSRIFRCSRSWLREEHSFDENDAREEFIVFGNSTYILDPTKCPTLFRILLVCHRWRDIALAESRLWTDINVDDPPSPLLSFMLEYSGIQPLSFSSWTQLPSPAASGRLKTVLNHISRIDSLSLDFSGHEPPEYYSRILSELFSAIVFEPGLKTLRIRSPGRVADVFIPSYQTLDIPPFPPSLSSITLDRVLLSVAIPCEGITSLHIEKAPQPWDHEPSAAMLHAIQNMPCLESLHIKYDRSLYYGRYVPPGETNTRVPPISLPRLRDFCFCGSPVYYQYIIPSLSIPVTTSRNIELRENCYHSERAEEGLVPPVGQLDGVNDSTDELNDHQRYFISDVENILAFRNLQEGREETFRVHFSLLFVEGSFVLKVLVMLAPKRRLGSSTFDDAVNVNDNDDTALVLGIRYKMPYMSRYMFNSSEELPVEVQDTVDIHATILITFISSISRAFRTDAVDHLHLSSNDPIFPELTSSFESDTVAKSKWTPSFLNWTEVRSLHVEGRSATEWIAPHLSETRQWGNETSVVVFPRLQELLLDKIDQAYYCDLDCYGRRELWSPRWNFDILELGKSWELVFQVRASCEGKKLQGLVLIEGVVCGRSEWNEWHAKLRNGEWIEDNNIRWVPDCNFDDPDDCSSHGDEECEKIEQSWGGVDCLDSDWYRRICAGLCHDFCARSLE
ncbi:uncharacterized protein STEHIDRAFT_151188 [Stereum hirsutum FP-91666 SS1]|uniref:uncharacterized protein n=1 Tax=Stereum hirsutum (strain FP-91666) TaxID=721885 RepID=UPI000440E692|nr:uncharacterized protein STEHIDRAFT_151188 [Stereum hirsutum FP-91666 SS1]EIM91831.1 hypothetical protein STEHIDRAFT_151188 [Stereum hirsutum FP-91666 SS1]